MQNESITDEELSAYLDAELDPARADEITARLAADEALLNRLTQLRSAQAELTEQFQALNDTPLPDNINELLQTESASSSASVLPFKPRPSVSRLLPGMAAAATIVLAVMLVWQQPSTASLNPQIAAILNDAADASSTPLADGQLQVLATYEAAQQRCRTYLHATSEQTRVHGLACQRAGSDWQVELEVSEKTAAGYQTATAATDIRQRINELGLERIYN